MKDFFSPKNRRCFERRIEKTTPPRKGPPPVATVGTVCPKSNSFFGRKKRFTASTLPRRPSCRSPTKPDVLLLHDARISSTVGFGVAFCGGLRIRHGWPDLAQRRLRIGVAERARKLERARITPGQPWRAEADFKHACYYF